MRRRVIARPVGSSVRLKCVASGHPRPDITWMKDDQALTRLEAGEHRKKWTLSLKNLRPEDSGKYTCRVSNRVGAINATYKVDVIRECQGGWAEGTRGWGGCCQRHTLPCCRADALQACAHWHTSREHNGGLWGHDILPVQGAQ